MKPLRLALLLAVLCGLAPLHAQEKKPAPKAAPAAAKVPPQAPDVPAPKLGADGKPDPGFIKSHENFVKIAKEGKAQLVFIGDSITAGWARHKEIWDKAFGAYEPANFGIGGDRTQHVLWRLTNGELDGIKPKVAVVMIGTNNSRSDSVEGIASGVKKIVETIREKSPTTKVLLLAIFPRGEKPNPQRETINQVNAIIARMEDDQHVFYRDIGGKFLLPDGTLPKEIMPDFLHPSAKGYEIWVDAIATKLESLMQ
jgi:lysophospholipase L1-like esterase